MGVQVRAGAVDSRFERPCRDGGALLSSDVRANDSHGFGAFLDVHAIAFVEILVLVA